MKKLVLALALTGVASTAFAGAHGTSKMADPVIEPPVIIEETRKSTAGVVIPIVLLLVAAAAIAANN
ncbi:hypothetical protein [Rhodobaculum claviforme]|uniref:Ferrochelatase n=1 Tax=Rhodobaculum claviforme TaxID=1549854 RepID=A0A934TM89_9RHOB|nr:hypothetical protein [Rhodobaculum claviforme]MBK5928462.1 hypothetical protein [Rhodobaculum claviforme]